LIRISPSTCHCVWISERPSIEGKFEKRCRIHQRATTLEVYQHNIDNQIKPAEITGAGKNARNTDAGNQRVRDLKESTRP